MIELEGGEIVYSTDSAEGLVGVVVYPWEVSVGHQHQPDSAMNVIEGEIRSVVHVGNRARVKVGPVTAEVTEASVDKLGLTAGRRVVATFKATGTRLVPYG
jgi:molybdopterin-binding protein